MGGDGGTVSTNRTYLRGAGKACHTADHPSNALKRAKVEDAERAKLILSTCAVSGAVLHLSPSKSSSSSSVSSMDLVACPYGKLYKRENVLEALLYRSQTTGTGGGGGDDKHNLLGTHIRGMKDLHPVRFHVVTSQGKTNGNGSNQPTYNPSCPITGSEFASGGCYLIVRTKSKDKKKNAKTDDNDEVANNPNVLSERAIKEMGIAGLQAEYGPFEESDMIRLAPTKTVFEEEIRTKWESRMEEERIAKLKKKKDKKRKRGNDEEDDKKKKSPVQPSDVKPSKPMHRNGGKKSSNIAQITTKKSAVDEARSTVQSAVAQNALLSNLFGTDKKKSNKTEDEKRRELFRENNR